MDPIAFPFTPNTSSPFQFQPTLGATLYTAFITWSLAGQRYYLSLYAANGGAWVLTVAAVQSSQAQPINLVAGYLPAPAFLYYDAVNSQFVAVS
jgi:hypothetical protein